MRKTRALAILAYFSFAPLAQAAPVGTHCSSWLAATPGAGGEVRETARALARAWEALFRIELESQGGDALKAWALALSEGQPIQEWLEPPPRILSVDGQAAFAQYAAYHASAEQFRSDPSLLRREWRAAISEMLRTELKREEARLASESARAARPLRIADRISLELGAPAPMTDVIELPDGRVVFSGFGEDDSFLASHDPRAAGTLKRIEVDTYPVHPGRNASALAVLGGGGFVVSTLLGQLGFHSRSGELIAARDTLAEPRAGNWNRAVETPDGTVVHVNRAGELGFYSADGTPKRAPIALIAGSGSAQPFVLQDGRIAVWSPRRFQIYDSSGRLHDDLALNPGMLFAPLELNDGSIAISVSWSELAIFRAGAPDGRLVREITLDPGSTFEDTKLVELESGSLVLASRVNGSEGLLFLDRRRGTRNFVPLTHLSQSVPVPTPNGGIAVHSRSGLVLLDGDGEFVAGTPVAPRKGVFVEAPVVFRPAGLPADAWRVAAIDYQDLVVVDENGNEVLRQQLVFPQPPAHAALNRLKVLRDGTLVTTDSRGVAQILRVELVGNGK